MVVSVPNSNLQNISNSPSNKADVLPYVQKGVSREIGKEVLKTIDKMPSFSGKTIIVTRHPDTAANIEGDGMKDDNTPVIAQELQYISSNDKNFPPGSFAEKVYKEGKLLGDDVSRTKMMVAPNLRTLQGAGITANVWGLDMTGYPTDDTILQKRMSLYQEGEILQRTLGRLDDIHENQFTKEGISKIMENNEEEFAYLDTLLDIDFYDTKKLQEHKYDRSKIDEKRFERAMAYKKNTLFTQILGYLDSSDAILGKKGHIQKAEIIHIFKSKLETLTGEINTIEENFPDRLAVHSLLNTRRKGNKYAVSKHKTGPMKNDRTESNLGAIQRYSDFLDTMQDSVTEDEKYPIIKCFSHRNMIELAQFKTRESKKGISLSKVKSSTGQSVMCLLDNSGKIMPSDHSEYSVLDYGSFDSIDEGMLSVLDIHTEDTYVIKQKKLNTYLIKLKQDIGKMIQKDPKRILELLKKDNFISDKILGYVYEIGTEEANDLVKSYIDVHPERMGNILKILSKYTKNNKNWKKIFNLMWQKDKKELGTKVIDNQNFLDLYNKYTHYDELKKKYKIHNKFGEFDLQKLRVERTLKDNCDSFLTPDPIRKRIILDGEEYIDSTKFTIEKINEYFQNGGDSVVGIGGLKGSGKTSLLRKLELDFLENKLSGDSEIEVISHQPFASPVDILETDYNSIVPYLNGKKTLPDNDTYRYYAVDGSPHLRSAYVSEMSQYIETLKSKFSMSAHGNSKEKVILVDSVIHDTVYKLIAKATGRKFIYTKNLTYENEGYNRPSMKMKVGKDGKELLSKLPLKMDPKLNGIYSDRINTIIASGIGGSLTAGNIEDFTYFLGSNDSWKIDEGMLKSEYVKFIVEKTYQNSTPDENRNIFESGKYNGIRSKVMKRISFEKNTRHVDYNDCLVIAIQQILNNQKIFSRLFETHNLQSGNLEKLSKANMSSIYTLEKYCNANELSDTLTTLIDSFSGPILDSLEQFGFMGVEYDLDAPGKLNFSNTLLQKCYLNDYLVETNYDIYQFFGAYNITGTYTVDTLLDAMLFNNTAGEYEKTKDSLVSCLSKESNITRKDLLEKTIIDFKKRLEESPFEIDISGFSSI